MDSKAYNTCVVCQETSDQVALHYARLLCNGCRAFFKRTVQGKVKVTECKAEGKCVMDPNSRKTCKACRYEACMKAGVDSSKVQQPRETGQDAGADGQDIYHNLNDSRDFDSPSPYVASQQFLPKQLHAFNHMQSGPSVHMGQHVPQGAYHMPPVINLHVPSIGIGVFNQHSLPASLGSMLNTAPLMNTGLQNSYGKLPSLSSSAFSDVVGGLLRQRPMPAHAPAASFDTTNGMSFQSRLPSPSFGQHQSAFSKPSSQNNGYMPKPTNLSTTNPDLLRLSSGLLGNQTHGIFQPWNFPRLSSGCSTTSFTHSQMHAPLPLTQPSVTGPYYYPIPSMITSTNSFIYHSANNGSLTTMSQQNSTPFDLSCKTEASQNEKPGLDNEEASDLTVDSEDRLQEDATARKITIKEEMLDEDESEEDLDMSNNNESQYDRTSITKPASDTSSSGQNASEQHLLNHETLISGESKLFPPAQRSKEQSEAMTGKYSSSFMIDSLLKPPQAVDVVDQLKTLHSTSLMTGVGNQCYVSTTVKDLILPPLPYQGHYQELLSLEQMQPPAQPPVCLPSITQFLIPTSTSTAEVGNPQSDLSVDQHNEELSEEEKQAEDVSQSEEINVVDTTHDQLLLGPSTENGDNNDTPYVDVWSMEESQEETGMKPDERREETENGDGKISETEKLTTSNSDIVTENDPKHLNVSIGLCTSPQGDDGVDSGLGDSDTQSQSQDSGNNMDQAVNSSTSRKGIDEILSCRFEKKEPVELSADDNQNVMALEKTKSNSAEHRDNNVRDNTDLSKPTMDSKSDENSPPTPKKKRALASTETCQYTESPAKRSRLSDGPRRSQNLTRQSPRKGTQLKEMHGNRQGEQLGTEHLEFEGPNKRPVHASVCKTPFSITYKNLIPKFTSTPIVPSNGDRLEEFCNLMCWMGEFLKLKTMEAGSETDKDTPKKTLLMSTPEKNETPAKCSSSSSTESGISSPEDSNSQSENNTTHPSPMTPPTPENESKSHPCWSHSTITVKDFASRMMKRFLDDNSYTMDEFKYDVLRFCSMAQGDRGPINLDGSYQDIN